MDAALTLKRDLDNGIGLSDSRIEQSLKASVMVQKLLQPIEPTLFNLLWRLTLCSEIPFSGRIPQVQTWAQQLMALTKTGNCFSINGTDDGMLVCYNAMIASLLIRLDIVPKEEVAPALSWIINYQSFSRGEVSSWEGSAIKKYGGCMKATPCFSGLVKSTIALSDANQKGWLSDDGLGQAKLKAGLEYLLNRHLYLRSDHRTPITNDVLKLTYPFTWKINVIELLLLMKSNGLLKDDRCKKALNHVRSKQKKSGYWQANSAYIHKHPAWIRFDEPGKPGEWLTQVIKTLM